MGENRGWQAELRESLIYKADYYGCPRVLTYVHLMLSFSLGSLFQVPGTWVPLLVLTIPCSMLVHLYAAWLTWLHPHMFTILGRRIWYFLSGSKIGRFNV